MILLLSLRSRDCTLLVLAVTLFVSVRWLNHGLPAKPCWGVDLCYRQVFFFSTTPLAMQRSFLNSLFVTFCMDHPYSKSVASTDVTADSQIVPELTCRMDHLYSNDVISCYGDVWATAETNFTPSRLLANGSVYQTGCRGTCASDSFLRREALGREVPNLDVKGKLF